MRRAVVIDGEAAAPPPAPGELILDARVARAGTLAAACAGLERSANARAALLAAGPLDEVRFPARGALALCTAWGMRNAGELPGTRLVIELAAGDAALAQPPRRGEALDAFRVRDLSLAALALCDEVRGDAGAREALRAAGVTLGSSRAEPAWSDPPRVAAVIAHKDHGAHLPDTLRSLRAQTVPLEIIVVDDGSGPEALGVLDRLQQSDPALVIRREPHRGKAEARNLGAQLTDAPLILFFDADNLARPRMVERLREALRLRPDASWAQPGIRLFHDETRETVFAGFPAPPFRSAAPLLLASAGGDLVALHRREAFLEAGGFPLERGLPEDWALWLRLVQAGRHGVVVPEVLFDYRFRPGARWAGGPLRDRLAFPFLAASVAPKLAMAHAAQTAQLAGVELARLVEQTGQRGRAEADGRIAELEAALSAARRDFGNPARLDGPPIRVRRLLQRITGVGR